MKKKIKLHKIEQGVCPYCGSTMIDYGCTDYVDDEEYLPAHCVDCGRDFEEWYTKTFVGHNVGDSCDITTNVGEEGKEIEIDEPSTLEPTVWEVADYLEELGLGRESLRLDETRKLLVEEGMSENLWDYPLDEWEHCVNDVGGKFAIVRFPNLYGGYEYRICQLPTK